jgi:PAS domain S-box-containing protein
MRWISWSSLALSAVALVVGMDMSGVVRQPNRMLQDAFVESQGRDVEGSDIVIVAIDGKTTTALGSWAFRRSAHAELIDRISEDAPRVIGLDVLLTESDAHSDEDDKALAASLQRSGKVVLPMTMQAYYGANPRTIQPVRALATSANSLGLDRLPIDNDGVLRNVYLREGLRDFELDHFSLAMLRVGEPGRFARQVPGSPTEEELPHAPSSGQWLDWRRSHKLIVPFAGPAGHFNRISYIDVLNGFVPPGTFQGKYVLVGATATGLGGLYEVPVAGDDPLMPGVEINANVMDSLLGRHEVTPAPPWLNTVLNVSAVLLALVGMAFLEPLFALLMAGALALVLLLVSGAVFSLLHLQLAPVAGMLGLGIAYTLWSWGRLNAATRYLIDASIHLRASASISQLACYGTRSSGDFLDRRIRALAQATRHLRDLHQFVSDSLNSLPDAKLVCDQQGRVRLANASAAHYFNVASSDALKNLSAIELMRNVRSSESNEAVVTADLLAQRATTIAVSARDGSDLDLLFKRSPSLNADGQHIGWILSIVDVTEMRQAQRQHDDAIHFLSHDMRAPQSAILTLLELDRHAPSAMSPAQFRERISRHARKALALSEGFIQLARARSQPYSLELRNLAAILLECVDDTWEVRRRSQVQVIVDSASAAEAFCRVDRDLVARAIDNLLGNAIEHSPPQSTIICAIERHQDGCAIRIQDQGPGISKDRQAAIFEPFDRGGSSRSRTHGAGLGLAFVKTVAARHGGRVVLQSAVGSGSTFRFVLPASPGCCQRPSALPAPEKLALDML